MKFHGFVYGTVGARAELEKGMAGKRNDLYQAMLAELGEYARFCDEAGFEGFGHPEHHLQVEGMEMGGDPGLLDLYLGMQTKRLRMDLFGYVLPTHNPLRVAEHVATLDHMLQGRLNIAFVRGYQARWFQCFAAVPGVETTGPWNRKAEGDDLNREVFEESVSIIKRAWSQDTFSYQGKHWTFPPDGLVNPHHHPVYVNFGKGVDADDTIREVGIAPRPYQQPHPPIYSGFTFSMRTALYWAKEGGKPVVLSSNLEFCQRLWSAYGERAARYGRVVPKGEEAAWGGYLVLADSVAQANEWANDARWFLKQWAVPFGQEGIELIIGDVDTVCRRLDEALKAVPFSETFFILGQGVLGRDKVMKTLDLVANKIMPRFG